MTAPLDSDQASKWAPRSKQRPTAFEGLSRLSLPLAEATDILRRRLDRFTNDSFLSFAMIGTGVSIWIADNRGMRFHVAEANTRDIIDAIEDAYCLCASPASDYRAIQKVGRFLYESLFQPIEYWLEPQRRLWIHFSAEFPYVPLLLLQNRRRQSFGDCFTFKLASRFPVDDAPGSHARGERYERGLLVDMTFARNGSDPADRRLSDLQLLGSLSGCYHLLDAGEANPETFCSLASGANLLFVRSTWELSERGPAFVFGETNGSGTDGQAAIASRSMFLQETNPEWLASCSLAILDVNSTLDESPEAASAASPFRGLGLRQLIRCLHGAGVSQVLLPLWHSPHASRAWFLRSLASNLQLGQSIDEAARKATADTRNHPHWGHPHHWAAFQFSALDARPQHP